MLWYLMPYCTACLTTVINRFPHNYKHLECPICALSVDETIVGQVSHLVYSVQRSKILKKKRKMIPKNFSTSIAAFLFLFPHLCRYFMMTADRGLRVD